MDSLLFMLSAAACGAIVSFAAATPLLLKIDEARAEAKRLSDLLEVRAKTISSLNDVLSARERHIATLEKSVREYCSELEQLRLDSNGYERMDQETEYLLMKYQACDSRG